MALPPLPAPVRRAARATARMAGLLTSGARMEPSFLIMGAQRCGTTSMYKTLSQHPDVLPAVLHKGAHYFDMHYDRGPGWYRGHFPLALTAARARRATGVRPVTGESSPYYLFHPCAAARIAVDLPAARLLVLLRDPVERAYSAYTHEAARGFETESFARALDLEPQRLSGEEERISAEPGYLSHSHQHHAYVTRGQYVDQLERLERLVGRERVHVVDSGDLFTDADPVYDGIVRFLGLRPVPNPEFRQHNARPRSGLPAALRTRLDEHFAPYDERLAAWLGAVPSWRR